MAHDAGPGETIDLRDYVEEELDEPEIQKPGDQEEREDGLEKTRALITAMIAALVDQPGAVRVRMVEGAQSVIFEVYVASGDVRRVIGRGGRTASAVRELLVNLGGKAGRRFMLEIMEPDGRLDQRPATATDTRLGRTEVIARPRSGLRPGARKA